jgi:hypothetical protein
LHIIVFGKHQEQFLLAIEAIQVALLQLRPAMARLFSISTLFPKHFWIHTRKAQIGNFNMEYWQIQWLFIGRESVFIENLSGLGRSN